MEGLDILHSNMNGILLTNKPKGITSSDVVIKLRKILNTRKIGHTSTLDPIAEGLLVITIGEATKISSILIDHNKEYIATFKLGIKTDTYDNEGKVLEENPIPKDLDIEKMILDFKGTYLQEVPIYSSVKVNGKKLYEYARNNIKVELPKREVNIEEIEVLDIKDNIVKIKCTVSKGTYIRSLINDIGNKLGCGATMTELVRTKVDNFSIDNSYTLEDIENNNYKLINIEDSLDYPIIKVDKELEFKISNGVKLDNLFDIKDKVIFLNNNNKLLGIYERQHNRLKPFRIFNIN
jgi:tRNA pseudouridine55 synthase